MYRGKPHSRCNYWTRPGSNKRENELSSAGIWILDERLDAWYGHAVASLLEGSGKASLVLLDECGDPTTDILELSPGQKAYFKKIPNGKKGDAPEKAVIDAFGDIQCQILELPEGGKLLVEFLI